MSGTDPLREGECWRYGSLNGLADVRVWIGKIDQPADLGQGAIEPIVSCIVMSMSEGMPVLGHAPFFLSAMLSDPHDRIEPFDVSAIKYADKYRHWRKAWTDDDASAWEDGPAEVYYQAIGSLLERGKQ